jgi:hypothetical protein
MSISKWDRSKKEAQSHIRYVHEAKGSQRWQDNLVEERIIVDVNFVKL